MALNNCDPGVDGITLKLILFNDRFNKNYFMSGVNDDCNLNCVQLNLEDELVISPQSDLTACIKGWMILATDYQKQIWKSSVNNPRQSQS